MKNNRILLLFLVAFSATKIFAQEDTLETQQLRSRCFEIDSIMRNDPSRLQTGGNNVNSSTFPVGIVKEIAGVKYIICIDSTYHTRQGAKFNVFMAVDFPGSYGKLAFAAVGIPFNPKGVLAGLNGQSTTLKLIGNQTIALGEKMAIRFLGDGSNYIQWGCDGYERINISADVLFNKSIIHQPDGQQVKAHFEINVEDISQLIVQTSIDPFVVKGLDDYEFRINQLAFDRNESANPSGIVLPAATAQLYPSINNWTGFYARDITVKLPEKLTRSNGAETTISVHDLVIDDYGVSGDFMATGVFGTTEADMENWNFSLDTIRIGIEYNQLTDGRLAGTILVPDLSDAAFGYSAAFYKASESSPLTYDFAVRINDTMTYELMALNSTVKLYPNCGFDVTVSNNKFIPSVNLNGKLTYNGSKAKLNDLTFQNLKISTVSPYILSGQFALTSSNNSSNQQSNVINLPLSLNSLQLGISQSNIVLGVDISLAIGSEGSSNNFGVSTSLIIKTRRETIGNRQRITYDGLTINNIILDCDTGPFALTGVIAVRNDDPVFGDLFFGSISFRLKSIMNNSVMVSAGFGKLSSQRYWYLDASIPVMIPINAVKITGLFGGVQYHVASTLTSLEKLDRAFGCANNGTVPTASTAIPFTPNLSMGLGFSAGVALEATSGESTFNGEALFEIQFNANGGFASIGFAGRVFLLTPRNSRENTNGLMVRGDMNMFYDNNNKIFDAAINASIISPDIITGQVNLKIHTDPNDWYFWMNRPSNRAYINVFNLFNINAYFMIGTQIDPIPAPPSYVTNVVSASPVISTDLSQVSSGQGFATGAQLNVSFGGEFPNSGNWRGYVYAGVGGGFDVMLLRLPVGSHCVGSTAQVGMNRWYSYGQVYVWLNGSVGIRKYNGSELKRQYDILSLNAAALLQGRLPKPSYVYGAIGFELSILGIIDLNFTADFEFGNDCQIVYN